MRRIALLLLIAAACAHRPLYVRSGSSWKLPLVDPLVAGELTVPVTINGSGPYLFVVAPHTDISVIDEGLARRLGLYSSNRWYNLRNQRDHLDPARVFEVVDLSSGDFRAKNVMMYGIRSGSLATTGRPIVGLLGADLISNSLVADIDRDRGALRLSVASDDSPPPGGMAINPRTYHGHVVLPAVVDGKPLRLALDLTAEHTATRGAAAGSEHVAVVDERGTAQSARLRAQRSSVRVDGVTADVNLVELMDRRVRTLDYDGVLGQDFLSRSRVVLDPHHGRLWLSARAPDLGTDVVERLSRWGADFAACAEEGCATVQRSGDSVVVTPLLGRSYEVTLEALDASARPLSAPLLHVPLTGTSGTVPLDAAHRSAATLRVVDAAPLWVATN